MIYYYVENALDDINFGGKMKNRFANPPGNLYFSRFFSFDVQRRLVGSLQGPILQCYRGKKKFFFKSTLMRVCTPGTNFDDSDRFVFLYFILDRKRDFFYLFYFQYSYDDAVA